MTSATTRVVVWFRNDLRLADNYVIKRAEALAAEEARRRDAAEQT